MWPLVMRKRSLIAAMLADGMRAEPRLPVPRARLHIGHLQHQGEGAFCPWSLHTHPVCRAQCPAGRHSHPGLAAWPSPPGARVAGHHWQSMEQRRQWANEPPALIVGFAQSVDAEHPTPKQTRHGTEHACAAVMLRATHDQGAHLAAGEQGWHLGELTVQRLRQISSSRAVRWAGWW